jgi:hypothetical protein
MDEIAKKNPVHSDKQLIGRVRKPHPSDIAKSKSGDGHSLSPHRCKVATVFCAFALCLISLGCGATDATAGSKAPAQFIPGSLCAKEESIVFSCPLIKSKKIVSICAAGDTSPHRFYYVFGRPNSPELVYPAKDSQAQPSFARSFLSFAGNTGGYAYSFSKDGYKYIVYRISGTGFENGGLMVQKSGEEKPVANLQCQNRKILDKNLDASGKDMFDETGKWPSDEDIKDHGLPFTPND